MLVQVGAVELGESVGVRREVRWDPVEHDTEPALVEVVDHEHQVLRRAVARRRGEVPGRLVAPRSVERVLHHGHHLDVGETGPLEVIGELHRERAVTTGLVAPRSEVDLVLRDRGVVAIARGPVCHPVAVAPVVVEAGDHRGGARRLLGGERERIALVEHCAAGGDDAVLVPVADDCTRNTPRPDTGRRRFEGSTFAGPAVEVTDHGHRTGRGCPDTKRRAIGIGVRAEQVREPVMRAFAESPQVVGGESRYRWVEALAHRRANDIGAVVRAVPSPRSSVGTAVPSSPKPFAPRCTRGPRSVQQ